MGNGTAQAIVLCHLRQYSVVKFIEVKLIVFLAP